MITVMISEWWDYEICFILLLTLLLSVFLASSMYNFSYEKSET